MRLLPGDRRSGNLPDETTSFVGRGIERAEAGLRLAENRLVTLTGVGGVGKTRLGLRVARENRRRYADGAWLVQLAPLRRDELVPLLIVESLGLADQTTRPAMDVLCDWLAGKRLLLVLDTCEHLFAGCVDATANLLTVAPELHVLATSRRPLGIRGEYVLPVDPLPATAPAASVAAPPAAPGRDPGRGARVRRQAGDSAAARLFVERASAAVPGFALDAGNRAAVAGICARLEGIPLALELAAARLPGLSVGELLRRLSSRLDSRLDLLTVDEADGQADGVADGGKDSGGVPGGSGGVSGGVCGVEPRHRALRTAIGWSHELCTPPERLLWARLSAFAGDFDAESARSVCADERLPAASVPALLTALAEKSIVTWAPSGGAERYRMLDTIREYGGQWLRELGEERELGRRHCAHYLNLARAADAAWMGPDQAAWYDRTVAEHANLRAALEFCLAEGDGSAALELGGALWFFWFACGFAREGRHYLERALAQSAERGGEPSAGTGAVPGAVRLRAVWACGLAAVVQGDGRAGMVRGRELMTAGEATGHRGVLNAAAHLYGSGLLLSGQSEEAACVLAASPPLEGPGDEWDIGRMLCRAAHGFSHIALGEFADAAAVARDLRAECVERGDRWMRSWADWELALSAQGRGLPDEADEHARTALEGKALLHDSFGSAMALDMLAAVAGATGRHLRAARLLGIAQRVWNTVGLPQAGIPELVAARRACEGQARDGLGDAAYEEAYREGSACATDDGIAYALGEG